MSGAGGVGGQRISSLRYQPVLHARVSGELRHGADDSWAATPPKKLLRVAQNLEYGRSWEKPNPLLLHLLVCTYSSIMPPPPIPREEFAPI